MEGAELIVVEDDELRRAGRATLARASLGQSVATLSVDQAIGVGQRPLTASVRGVVVVVRRAQTGWDRYPGVAAIASIVEGVAAQSVSGPPAVVAVVSRFASPLLRVRAASAGAAAIVESDQTGSEAGWLELVHRMKRGGSALPSIRRADTVVGAGVDPNAVLALIVERGLESVFTGLRRQRDSGLTRRQTIQLRTQLARVGGIRPSAQRSHGGPVRDLAMPTWRDALSFVDEARGEAPW